MTVLLVSAHGMQGMYSQYYLFIPTLPLSLPFTLSLLHSPNQQVHSIPSWLTSLSSPAIHPHLVLHCSASTFLPSSLTLMTPHSFFLSLNSPLSLLSHPKEPLYCNKFTRRWIDTFVPTGTVNTRCILLIVMHHVSVC